MGQIQSHLSEFLFQQGIEIMLIFEKKDTITMKRNPYHVDRMCDKSSSGEVYEARYPFV